MLFRKNSLTQADRPLAGDVVLTPPASLITSTVAVLVLFTALLSGALFIPYSRTVSGQGSLVPVGGTVDIFAPIDGTIVSISVRDGDQVQASKTVMQISAATYGDGRQSLTEDRIAIYYEQVDDLLAVNELREEQHKHQVTQLQSQIHLANQQLSVIEEKIQLQKKLISTIDDDLRQAETLSEQGHVPRTDVRAVRRELLTSQSDLLALRGDKVTMNNEVSKLRRQLSEQIATFGEDSTDIDTRVSELELRIAEEHLTEHMSIKAPKTGKISWVAVRLGTVVRKNDLLTRVFDEKDPLIAVIQLPNSAVGRVRLGQSVNLRYSAYPFYKYGAQDGIVEYVSGATVSNDRMGYGTSSEEGLYLVKVALPNTPWGEGEQPLPLKPGMTVEASFVLERASVAERAFAGIRRALQ